MTGSGVHKAAACAVLNIYRKPEIKSCAPVCWFGVGHVLGRCGPEAPQRAHADAHDAGPPAFEMSAPGVDASGMTSALSPPLI